MARGNISVGLFCCDGLFQRDLMHCLADAFQLKAIVIQSSEAAKGGLGQRLWRYRNPLTLTRYLVTRARRPAFEAAARPVIERLLYRNGRPPEIPPGVPVVTVANINDPRTAEVLDASRPDVVAVNGTQLIRSPLLDRASSLRLGMINLHTGLSPYSRGGNCNLFMLLEGKPEFVGITIHHLDAGIDRGDIILTARPDMDESDTLETIDAKTFALGNRAMVTAIRQLDEGKAERVPQWTAGKLFLKRTGYVYDPYLHVRVNAVLRRGLIRDYLAHKPERDGGIRLVGSLDA